MVAKPSPRYLMNECLLCALPYNRQGRPYLYSLNIYNLQILAVVSKLEFGNHSGNAFVQILNGSSLFRVATKYEEPISRIVIPVRNTSC